MSGPLQPLHATGEWAGKFHCPVCEAGLNSAVLIFARDMPQPGQPLVQLLQGLEAAMEQHPGSPAEAAVIFITDGDYKAALGGKIDDKAKVTAQHLTQAITAKDQLVGELTGLADAAKLKRVMLALAAAEDVKDYRLNKDAVVTVIGYSRHKVLVNRAFAKNQLTDAEVKKLLAELSKDLPVIGVPKY
jgi:hypothetical protein